MEIWDGRKVGRADLVGCWGRGGRGLPFGDRGGVGLRVVDVQIARKSKTFVYGKLDLEI